MGPHLAGDYECHLEPLRHNKLGKTQHTAATALSRGLSILSLELSNTYSDVGLRLIFEVIRR